MRLQTLLLPLLALLPTVLSNPALSNKEECPVIALKDKTFCLGQTSTCWSPGKGDVDCPNNGLCCFNGCVNQCRIPEVSVYVPPPVCKVEYQEHEEIVEEDHCVDVPDLQMCTKTEKQQCRNECRIVNEKQTVQETTKCCKTHLDLVCEDAPCDENEFHEVNVDVSQEICKKQDAFCFSRPRQECTDKNVDDCKTVQKEQCEKTKKPKTVQRNKKVCTQKRLQKCEIVKKPTEWPTTKEECTTKYKEECETAYKEWCPSTTRVPYVYHAGTPTTQDRYGYRALTSTTRDRYTREAGFKKKNYAKFGKSKLTAPVRENLKYVLPDTTPVRENLRYVLPDTRAGCKQMPYKKCTKKPYNHCETKTTITIEYEDEEVCTPYTEDICVDEPVYETVFEEVNQCRFVPERVCTQRVVTECKTINRQECVKSSRTCNTRDLQEKQRVRNNCRVKDKVCKYKENEQCQVTKQPVEKWVPKRVCKDVCEPVVTNVCAPKTTRQQCKKIPKKMFYQVPVEQC